LLRPSQANSASDQEYVPFRGTGTLISGDRSDGDQLAKGISSIAGLTLLTIGGLSEWLEFPESPSDYFVRWHPRGVNVILISQASSEHTIGFAVREAIRL